MHTGSASVNGEISSLDRAQIPLLDRGFLFGHGVFETVLVLDGGLVLWKEHMARLSAGCKKARIVMPSVELLLEQALNLTRDNIKNSGRTEEKMQLRIVITGGNSYNLWESEQDTRPPNIIMFCRNIPGVSAAWYREGISLQSSLESRASHTIDIKSTNYFLHMLALATAQDSGNEDAIFVTSDGEFRESTTASFLWIDSDGNLATCPTEQRCLPGTTLIALKRALAKKGDCLLETALTRATLGKARGAAILSATRGLVPVRSIDNHTFDVILLSIRFSELNALLLKEQKSQGYISPIL